jgi:60 kDa SS-A/Ro ribonucleoprotein
MVATTYRHSPYIQYLGANKPGYTSQRQPLPGLDQVQNNAGGYVFKLDPWKKLERFLILGTESSTYYTSSQALTKDNAQSVLELIKEDGVRVVNTILDISKNNRAPKVDPLLFTLALCLSYGDKTTKRAASKALPNVARTGTHLFLFLESVTKMRGFGRILREAISSWYLQHEPI